MNNKLIFALPVLIVSASVLQGCVTTMTSAAATGLGGYGVAQNAGHPAAAGYGQPVSTSCSEMRTELQILDKHIKNYHEHQAAATMQQYPTSAGEQVATQAATDIAVRNAPSTLPYLQPLLASAKGFMDNMSKPEELKTAESRKELVLAQYNQKCASKQAGGYPVMSKQAVGDPVTKEIQSLLNDMGYPCGVADGIAGAKTDTAIRRYQQDRGLLVDGRASPELLAMMKKEMEVYE